MTLPKPPSLRCLRSFSTTLRTPLPTTQPAPPRYTKGPPPYPYGPALHYKQSDSGLYGGATVQFGNKVSEKNALKSRRAWRPNIHNKRLWSDAMGRFVQVKVRARVLRTIDKCGGLDGYLLGEKPGRIKELGVEGWRLRWLVMRTGTVRRRVQGEREALGLVGRGGTSRSRQEVKAEESAEADLMLEEEIGRASGEVVEQIGRAPEAPLEAATEAEAEEPGGRVETFPINPPSSKPPALEDRIKRITQAIEDEITRQHAQKTTRSSTATALPSQPDEPGITPSKPPGRVSTKSEERAPREQQALKSLAPDSYRELEIASGKTEIALRAEVARIEEAVEAEMEEAEGDGKGVERLEVAMEMMRSASEELERVKAVKKERVRGKGEKAEGGVLGKIKALFSRR